MKNQFRFPLSALESGKQKGKLVFWNLEFDIWYIVVGTTHPILYPKHENPNVTCNVIFLKPSSLLKGCHNIYHGFYDLT